MKVINIKGTIIPKQNKWIYDWLEYPYTVTDDVLKALQEANGDDVEVHINCYGGSVYDGYEIYTALREYKGNLLIKIVGLAASAASFIAMAGRCLMSPLAEMMIHNASTGVSGPHQVMDATSQQLQVTDSTIAKAYVIKSGRSEEEIRALMEKETWFTADKAKELGLIDGIMFEENDATNNIVPVLYNSLPIPSLKAIEELEKCGSIEELKKKLAANAEEMKKNIATSQSTVVDNNKEEGNKDMEIKNVEDLKKAYPELVKEIENSAAENARTGERERLKAIDEISNNLAPTLVNKAKYEEPMNAEKLAFEAIKADAAKGTQMLSTRKEEIYNSNVTKVDNQLPKDEKKEEAEAVNNIIAASNRMRGGK